MQPMHDTNQVEQSYQDPELPEAYNAPAILDSMLYYLCSTLCSLAECDSAWPGTASGADGSRSFTTGRHVFLQKLVARQGLTLCLPSCGETGWSDDELTQGLKFVPWVVFISYPFWSNTLKNRSSL